MLKTQYQMPYASGGQVADLTGPTGGLGSTHTPLNFRPIVLDRAIMNKYLYAEGLRRFFTNVNLPLGVTAYRWMVYEETVGQIDWLNEYDQPPLIDETYTEDMASVKSYGWRVQWTDLEMRTNRYDMINERIDSGVNLMTLREDAAVIAAMTAACTSGRGNEVTISDWDNTSTGDPAKDITQLKRTVRTLTNKAYTPNVLIMNDTMHEKLMDFDFVRNNMYTTFMFNQTGEVPVIAGQPITIVDSVPDDHLFYFVAGSAGEWLISEPLQTRQWQVNPRLFEEWMWTTSSPIVRKPLCIIEGILP